MGRKKIIVDEKPAITADQLGSVADGPSSTTTEEETLPPTQQEVAPVSENGKRLTNKDMIKQALAAGVDEKSNQDIAAWIKANLGAEVTTAIIASTKSIIRKEVGGGETSSPRRSLSPSPFHFERPTAITTDDLKAVKAAVMEHGDIDSVWQMVQDIQLLADKVGGLDKLKKCLEDLVELMK
jgi:hypothetical protein